MAAVRFVSSSQCGRVAAFVGPTCVPIAERTRERLERRKRLAAVLAGIPRLFRSLV